MAKVFAKAGLRKEAVVLCRIYIPDAGLWDEVNQIYAQYFSEHKPARVVMPTGKLHHGAMAEMP